MIQEQETEKDSKNSKNQQVKMLFPKSLYEQIKNDAESKGATISGTVRLILNNHYNKK